jgi:Mg2+-importing ATPase
MPSEKSAGTYKGAIADPFDLPNLCFMGGSVVSGFSTGVIVHRAPKPILASLRKR